MNVLEKYFRAVEAKNSRLCVGLDTTLEKIPHTLASRGIDGMYKFNRQIIKATAPYAACYKINLAFYEQYGAEGFELVKKTLAQIPDDIVTIADAKRGDIGNTSKAYARAVFDDLKADAVTVSPYMGSDSVEPFLFGDKFVFVLALTSNVGSGDFQRLESNGKPLFMHVIEKSCTWAPESKLGFVVGATHPDEIAEIRKVIPERLLLIPGVGTQGGDLEGTRKANGTSPYTINVSRDILYRTRNEDFAELAGERAKYYAEQMGK